MGMFTSMATNAPPITGRKAEVAAAAAALFSTTEISLDN